ncbi:MAG: tRNA (N(6)-L-threonylcarbamoyladenosine(37)-C(2))-methylthiotransferase [Candidatus Aenigmarchaeota archaeon]|nr:tRNA (N(6)-L-threonylcarbamoyladenosine(37)-C(2))-methylthiotransferase [Candidatus Aenigmarchaeota archaeon]
MRNKKIYLETLGCSFNHADSEIMSGLLKNANFQLTDNPSTADVIILNTCYVKSATQNRVIHKIKSFQTNFPEKKLVIAGCMTEIDPRMLDSIAPNSSWIGPHRIKYIVDVVNNTINNNRVRLLGRKKDIKVTLPKVRSNPIIDIIQICEGCSSFCSYCCTRIARGKLFSYPIDSIAKEVNQAIKDGCKELWITSQDNSCYGKDINTSLPELLNEVCKVKGKFFVRVGMMNPTHIKDIIDELIESYKSEKIFKFLHLPVQSGSDRILKSMNRNYRVKDFKEIVKKFREEFPLLTFSTDVIVGFSGESDKDFHETVKLMKRTKPDIVNISKFGPRPGTEAEKMKQLPREIIDRRTKKINEVIERIKIKNSKKWMNWKGEVLIDEIGKKGGMIGRNFAYKPVVTSGRLGTFREVRIIEVRPNYLIGK